MGIFEKIIAGEIPATKIYEDDQCLAFLDINPVSKGHTLLIPKTGYGRVENVPDEVLGYLMSKLKKIVVAMKAGLGCDFAQVDMVGKDIPDHFHIHIIPRTNDDNVDVFHHTAYSEGEMGIFAEKIKAYLE